MTVSTKQLGLRAEVVDLASRGRMHYSYIDLEQSEIHNARNLIRDLAKEVIRLRTILTVGHGECVDQEKK